MAITVENFFRFGGKYPRLLQSLFESTETLDRTSLRALIERSIDEGAPLVETIEEQLVANGILAPLPFEDAVFELQPQVRDLLAWILKRQELATADVIRGYLEQLSGLMKELQESLNQSDFPALIHPLMDLDRTMDKLRSHAEGNFESITSRVQELQSKRREMTPRERFVVINRIWHRMLTPLRDLIDDRGQMEVRMDLLNRLLVDIYQEDMIPRNIRREAGRSRARLAYTRRVLSDRHSDAVREIQPLYEQLRVDSMLLEGAVHQLEILRRFGVARLEIDAQLGLEGWRPTGLISDDHLQARTALLAQYEPPGDIFLKASPPPVDYDPLDREEIRQALHVAQPVDDVFGFLIERWPQRTLSDILRVFGWIHRGEFGPGYTDLDACERAYRIGPTTVFAWPLSIDSVDV